MIIKQLFDHDTWTYTYLLADPITREAVIIDPVAEKVSRDLQLLDELGLSLVYILDTHVHADHVTGSGELRRRTGARAVVSAAAGVGCANVAVKHGDRLFFGSESIEVRSTPGHTVACATYVARDGDQTMAFTGDALFVRGCGRTDFQGGSAERLYRSVHQQIYSLPEDTIIYPGHDYRGNTSTTVAEEKENNPRLNVRVSEQQFIEIMGELHLPSPKLIDVAVPANQVCGRSEGEEEPATASMPALRP